MILTIPFQELYLPNVAFQARITGVQIKGWDYIAINHADVARHCGALDPKDIPSEAGKQ
jgi:hypothetical protein